MPYLLLAIAAVVGLIGFGKVARTTQPGHGVPWGGLIVWAILLIGGLSIWLAAARIH
jgi:hypothetical protein